MKIRCDFCEHLIDTNKDSVCPNCGASFGGDKEVKKELDRIDKDKDLDIEERKVDIDSKRVRNEKERALMENRKTGYNAVKWFLILLVGPPAVFAIFLFIIIVIGVVMGLKEEGIIDSSSNSAYITEIEETIIEDKPIKVGFNEEAVLSEYSVTIAKAEEIDGYPYDPNEGYMFVDFYFIIANLTDEEIYDDESIRGSVNGIKLKGFYKAKNKRLEDGNIPVDMKIDGWVCYEVPLDAENITIKYGDYITIEIPMDKVKRLKVE